jgi:ATP-dependent helicase Lhr and Lhr-like helicase
VLVPLQGLALPAEVWERDVLPRRLGAYSPTWLDALCAAGDVVWVGAGSLGRSSGRVALYFREDAEAIGPPAIRPAQTGPPAEREHELVRERLAASPCFFTDLLAEVALAPEQVQEALWDLVWAGEVTNDAFAPLRAPRLTLARARQAPRPTARRFGARRGGAQPTVQGRWAMTETIFRREPEPDQRRRTIAELLLERYGILTREQVLAEGIAGGFSILYDALSQLETLGVCRRGYFIEGLGGAQFALPGAVERLRAQSAVEESAPLVLAATDPAQPYGAALPWPQRGEGRRPARVRGAYVVLAGAEPVLYVEPGGRGMVTLVAPGDARLRPSFEALARFVTAAGGRRLSLERVDGEPVVGSPYEAMLVELGFRAGPRKLTLSA